MISLKNLNPKNIDPASLPEGVIQMAFDKLKEYCEEKKVDMQDLVKDESRIPEAAKEIYSRLPMMYKPVFKEKTIHELLTKNIDFIRTKVDEYAKGEDKAKDVGKALDDLF